MPDVYFAPPFPDFREKGCTYRLWDSESTRKIIAGKELTFKVPDNMDFARAICSQTKKTTFRALVEEDWIGHERFANDKEMLAQYEEWNKKKLSMSTAIKIIRWNDYLEFESEVLRNYMERYSNKK